MNKKVVIFGGGTGITKLLCGLKLFPIDLTAVISVSDNGASTGKLRDEFSMPAMGDIRKVITSLSNVKPEIKELLEYRFNTYSDLNGHPIGNLLLVGMYNLTGSLQKSITTLSEFLDIEHKVLPLSEDSPTLLGETLDGRIIHGEESITKANTKYKRIFYEDKIKVLPEVIDAITNADMIIFSFGSLYTSILPHLISPDVIKAIDKSKAELVYTCNAVTQPGETDDFRVSDHVEVINRYLGKRKLDAVIASNSKVSKQVVERYETSEQKDLVPLDRNNLDLKVIAGDLIVIEDGLIRHNSLKTSLLLFEELMK